MHLLETIASTVLGAIGGSCLLFSMHFLYKEIGEVNRKLPDDQQASYLWWHAEKYLKLHAEYKRLYPSGNLHRLQFWFKIAGLVFLLLAAAASGFFKTL